MARGRDLEHAQAARLEVGLDELGQVARLGDVDLVEDDEARTLGERHPPALDLEVLRVGGELRLDDVEVADRVPAGLERRAVEHVHDHRGALDVAQELQAEALALARARDEAGDVRDGEARRAGLHDPRLGTSVVNG